MKADINEIRRAAKMLFDQGTVVELRTPKAGKFKTISGYFDDLEALAQAAVEASGRAAGTYWTLNPVNADLLARCCNRAQPYAENTTSDSDILARRWLLIDCDPKRPSGISSTDSQKQFSVERIYMVRDFLRSLSWPDPIIADSGNGAHLLSRIDLPNDALALQLVSNVLKALDKRFSDSAVAIDITTANAARICKVYGTLSAKGDNTPERPHRLSKILEVPGNIQIVPSNLLVALAAEVQQKPESKSKDANGRDNSFDIYAFLQEHNIEVLRERQKPEGQFIELKYCPWNKEHTGGRAWVATLNSGAVAAGCQHASCSGKGWNEFKTALGLESFEFLSVDGICQRYIEGMTAENSERTMREIQEAVPKLDSIARGLLRESIIEKLKSLGIKAPAKLADAVLQVQKDDGPSFVEAAPWPKAVDGAAVLSEASAVYSKYLSLPPHGANIHALWDIHTWCLPAFFTTPILNLESAIMRSGKTRTHEIKQCLVCRAALASNITAAVVYRLIDTHAPTLLLDELDSYMDEKAEALRGILNSGNNRNTAFVWRCVGDSNTPQRFSTFAARSVAHIRGKLPDTLRDRSITISMKRRKPSEKVSRLRSDKLPAELSTLARKMARWSADNMDKLRELDPEVPEALNDRAQDNWRPLICIADLAGGAWPKKARDAAIALSEETSDPADFKIQLLADFQKYFDINNADRVFTATFIEYLKTLDERKWAIWKNAKPITVNTIAWLLKDFDIHPKDIRIGNENFKGYLKADFEDAFMRNLETPDLERDKGDNEPPRQSSGTFTDRDNTSNVTDEKPDLSDCKQTDVTDVTDENKEICPAHNICKQIVSEFGGLACPECLPFLFEPSDFDGLGVS